MLEGLVAWVLNNSVGKYVENLNTSQLSVGILQGQVELEDLPLKKQAFRQLLFPLEIKNGYIGRIVLKIPVTRLRTEPWVIVVERLYIVVGPVSLDQYNGELYEQLSQVNKLSKLDAFEAEWKSARLRQEARTTNEYYTYSYSSWLTYGSSLVSSAISNLQLRIQDVHIRYEDLDSITGKSFAWGLLIKSAQSENAIPSTGGSGSPGSGDLPSDAKSYVSQQLQLKGVSLYWDQDAFHVGGLELNRMANCMDNLRNFCVRANETSCEHNFLLSTPEGATLLLSRNQSERPLRSRDEPRVKCTFQVSMLPISIADGQYQQMVRCFQNIDINHKKWKYQKWRPTVPVKGNCKTWWMFAVKATTEALMKRRACATMEYALKKAQEVNRYVKLYRQHLTEDGALAKEQLDDKSAIEKSYDFETLLSLREIIMKRIDDESNSKNVAAATTAEKSPAAGGGLLQYFFPGWTGWYGGTNSATPDITGDGNRHAQNNGDSTSVSMVSIESSIPSSQFEEELLAALNRLDDEHYLLRDATLAHVTFQLKTCTITILQQVGRDVGGASGAPASAGCRELAVLRVEDVWAQLKSHPRARSYCLHVKVGGLQFSDRTLPTLVYTHLVAPHIAHETQMSLRSGQKISVSDLLRPRSAGAGVSASPTPPGSATTPAPVSPIPPPLFEVLYEKNPLGSTADHRLVMNTQSLDIVYSPSTVQALKSFLRPAKTSATDDLLTDAVKQHLEQLKQETKTSLRSKVDAMLSGRQVIQRWDLCLDICAPQIIVPESFTDRASVAVMFDLGRLQLRNLTSFDRPKTEKRRSSSHGPDENDDEDFFQTPCSSPPGENDLAILSEPRTSDKGRLTALSRPIISPSMESCAVSEADFRERMYDKYSLNLQDMQVMVTTCSRESWKFAQLRGSSHLHVIDRFNISLQMERRILFTDDPQFPSIVVHGQLPKLVLHVSEQKVSALTSCLKLLGTSTSGAGQEDLEHKTPTIPPVIRIPLRRPNDDSVLFLGRFVIEQMSVELQSRGRCLAELQVSGVEVTCTRHPRVHSLQLRVQGLLLVDALQTYGPDFDLLLASHKHITMDSRSGSIRDSEPASPISPASPKGLYCVTPPLTAAAGADAGIKPNMLTSLLNTLHISVPPLTPASVSHSDHSVSASKNHDSMLNLPIGGDLDNNNQSDALIVVDMIWTVDQDDYMQNDARLDERELEQDLVLHVAFNNLDVIANQETIVELVTFAQSILKATQQQEMAAQVVSAQGPSSQSFKVSSVNVSFDFHRLNILLLRSSTDKSCTIPTREVNLKLATATLSGARIDAQVGDILDLQVVLGGLQVCDLLSPKRIRHERPKSADHAPSGASTGSALAGNYVLSVGINPDTVGDEDVPLGRKIYNTGSPVNTGDSAALMLHVIREYPDTAAVHWNSTLKRRQQQEQQRQPQQQNTGSLKKQRKTGVTERRSGSKDNLLVLDLHLASVVYTHCPRLLLELTNCAFEFRSYVTKFAASLRDAAAEVAKGIVGSELPIQDQLNVNVSVILETPVVILPCEASRPLVLVAHLGRVAISSLTPRPQAYRVELKNTSLYTLDSERSPDLDCARHGKAILHNTHVELTLQKGCNSTTNVCSNSVDEEFIVGHIDIDEADAANEDTWQLDGYLVGPLKVALSKSQFSQLLETLAEMSGNTMAEAPTEKAAVEPLDAVRVGVMKNGTNTANKIAAAGTLEAARIRAHFAIAEFLVEFCEEQGKPFARVAFHEFDFEMVRHLRQSRINMSLHGLNMEDLYEEETSAHRTLISSQVVPETPIDTASGERPVIQPTAATSSKAAPIRCDYLSVSCPSLGMAQFTMATPVFDQPAPPHRDDLACSALSHSLPDVLCTKNLFKKLDERRSFTTRQRSRHACCPKTSPGSTTQDRNHCPQTPPPSPTPSLHSEPAVEFENQSNADGPSETTLVKIEVVTQSHVGARLSPGHNRRKVNIDINSLLVCINVRPWVMIVDLLSRPAYGSSKTSLKIEGDLPIQDMNTTIEMSVQNLSLQLNSSSYEICEAQVRQLWVRQEMTPCGINMQGRLGKVLIFDLTPFGGKVYQERFVTAGNEAFQFAFRTTDSVTDCYTLECNIPGSVRIVHTHLFLCEIINFISEFTMSYDSLTASVPAMHEASRQEGDLIQQREGRQKARVDLRVTADAPLIVLPRNSHHFDTLVLNLGRVDICTTFEQTLCLNQVMQLSLSDMDMYCGEYIRAPPTSSGVGRKHSLEQVPFRIKKKGSSLLDNKFELSLKVMRNLDAEIVHSEPDYTVRGHVSQASIFLDKDQYQLVAGILFENLSEGVHLQTSAPAPVVAPAPEDDAWLHLCFVLDLHNVTLSLVKERAETDRDEYSGHDLGLARIEFIDSKLSVSLFTNGRKDVDLVSQEIRVYDTRFKNAVERKNVFADMLLPTQSGNKGDSKAKETRGLQMELHYRTFPNRLTVLLNNMRLMAVFDWFRQTSSFLALPSAASQTSSSAVNKSTADPTASGLPTLHGSVDHGMGHMNSLMPIQLKVSMTDTEVVVVEDASTFDSNAVILKSTAVLTWHGPAHRERPLICDLQNLEVFSCVLGTEDETALSIIDPATISFELNLRPVQATMSTTVAAMSEIYELEASSQLLCIRLSYNDIKMFHRILECVSGQAVRQDANQAEAKIAKLRELGFSQVDCAMALDQCQGRIDDAALWLLQNAQPLPGKVAISNGNRIALLGLSVSTASVKLADFRICFIDDCGNADVPLLELRLRDTDASLALDQRNWQVRSLVHMDYYNRILSGWEPLLEPISIGLHWRRSSSSMHIVELDVDGLLYVNITSALINIIQRVRESWKGDNKECAPSAAATAANKRIPFVPFALKNSLGCNLEFATTTALLGSSEQSLQPQQFYRVPPGATVPFAFVTSRGAASRLRHQESHELQARQIIVRVDGCDLMAPLSVDRVGTYFRLAKPANSTAEGAVTRVVFHIELEGPALKVINVRSALMLKNFTDREVVVNITTSSPVGSLLAVNNKSLPLAANSSLSLPFAFNYTSLKVRPLREERLLPTELGWKCVTFDLPEVGVQRECRALHAGISPCYFAVTVRRDPYPRVLFNEAEKEATGHSLLLRAPLKLYNLLPLELHYSIERPVPICGRLSGVLKNRCSVAFHQIQSEDNVVIINLQLDGYTSVNQLELDTGNTPGTYTYTLLMQDAEKRSLLLKANVVADQAKAYKVYVCAQYWLINHTGLPLIFKQDGVFAEAAGQPPEHEAARSVAPLLFSFCDMESPKLCCVRLGSRCQVATASAGGATSFQPKWSQPFPLESGVGICKLFLSSNDNSPDRMFNIGIYGEQGKGVYRDTHFIVFSPLFQLVNNTNMTLDFAQKFVTTQNGSSSSSGNSSSGSLGYERHITSAMPKSSVAFHWPRVDLEPLLCIRAEGSLWSGGFHIDKAMSSTHIHVRTLNMQSLFVLVEVRMHAGTYIVTFSQPESAPEPMRIENLSEVPITFCQAGAKPDLNRQYVVKASTAMPYAWDEPTMAPLISVEAPGGTSEIYDMRTFKAGNRLYYENFFYIAFTGTFLELRPAVPQKSTRTVRSQELVLDVKSEGRVIINRKITGSRSQLWRMTPDRMLQHEGSSTPRIPQAREASPGASMRRASGSQGRVFVLDIDAPAADPHRCVPLVLRKPDPRRRSLQTWTFTEDGALKCDIENLYVQSKNGLKGLQKGVEAVLGPKTAYEATEFLPNSAIKPLGQTTLSPSGSIRDGRQHYPSAQRQQLPLHCGVSIQKMRGGCGVLCVRVFLDGPTIVLRVTDLTREESSATVPGHQMSTPLPGQKRRVDNSGSDIQIKVNFKNGVGVSFINETEEILLVTLEGVLLSFYQSSAEDSQTFDMSVRQMQIDNMLGDAERPCALYMSPPESRSDQHSYLPAFCVKASRLINYNTDTLVFDHFLVSMKDTTLALEEKLMLKLFQMFQAFIPWLNETDDLHLIEQRSLAGDVLRDYERKLYFNKLQVEQHQCKLSVLPARAGTLDEGLRHVKKQINWSLIRFEDAVVHLSEFERNHPFETLSFLLGTASAHYSKELSKQARTIMGNVDFFGSPLGFYQDVRGGLKEAISEKNPITLFKSITHGALNSAAKLTGSLSDGLRSIANLDNNESAIVVAPPTATGTEHFIGGLRGFSRGIVYGFTGLIVHPYHGLTTGGLTGFMEGVGRGLMGSGVLPTVGVLDLATGMAAALRDSAKTHARPERRRPPRLSRGPRGLLPVYSAQLAEGQMLLTRILAANAAHSPSERNAAKEFFLVKHPIEDGGLLVVSNQRILRVSTKHILLDEVHLSEVRSAHLCVTVGCSSLVLKLAESYQQHKRIDCGDSDEANISAIREIEKVINYAVCTCEEERFRVITPDDDAD